MDSPSPKDPEQLIFIIGAGRSGTTWLHLMLGSHPRVATGQESQIFSEYLAPLYRRWRDELEWPDTETVRQHGISSYVKEDEFVALLRGFALEVLGRVLAEKPGATHLLEKSPSSSYHVDLIHRCLPETHFIHVIRDGRDVATSMLKARLGWGKSWAPSRAEDAAKEWVKAVWAARSAANLTSHYTEVRYEDLLSEGVDELQRVFRFVGLPVSDDEASEIYERFDFDRLKKGDYDRAVFKNPGEVTASGTEERREPPGFFRKGKSGTWRDELSRAELNSFLWVAGDLLEELGYLGENDPRPLRRAPLSAVMRSAMYGVRRRLVWVGKRALGSR